MASEVQNFCSITRSSEECSTIRYGNRTINAIFDSVYVSSSFCSLSMKIDETSPLSIVIPSENIAEFLREFLQTWGKTHHAHLHVSGTLEAIDYNPRQTPKWTLRFKSKVEENTLKVLSDYLNPEEPLSLQDQVRRIQTFVKSILGLTIVYEKTLPKIFYLHNIDVAADCLSKISFPSKMNISLKSFELDNPLKDHCYTLNNEGDWRWGNRFLTIAKSLEDDPDASEFIRSCAAALKELLNHFPLQDPTSLKELIQKASDQDLAILKKHLKQPEFLSAQELADEVDAILKEIIAHQNLLSRS